MPFVMARWVQVPSTATFTSTSTSSPRPPMIFPLPCWQFPLYALINWKQRRKTLWGAWGDGNQHVMSSVSCKNSNTPPEFALAK